VRCSSESRGRARGFDRRARLLDLGWHLREGERIRRAGGVAGVGDLLERTSAEVEHVSGGRQADTRPRRPARPLPAGHQVAQAGQVEWVLDAPQDHRVALEQQRQPRRTGECDFDHVQSRCIQAALPGGGDACRARRSVQQQQMRQSVHQGAALLGRRATGP
jgi:hypothetical protein